MVEDDCHVVCCDVWEVDVWLCGIWIRLEYRNDEVRVLEVSLIRKVFRAGVPALKDFRNRCQVQGRGCDCRRAGDDSQK